MDDAKIDLANGDRLMPTGETCHACGGISPSTLWRWYTEGDFPRPQYVLERRFWLRSEVEAWLGAQFARPASARRRGAGLRNVTIPPTPAEPASK